jgi:hypothetical protein
LVCTSLPSPEKHVHYPLMCAPRAVAIIERSSAIIATPTQGSPHATEDISIAWTKLTSLDRESVVATTCLPIARRGFTATGVGVAAMEKEGADIGSGEMNGKKNMP